MDTLQHHVQNCSCCAESPSGLCAEGAELLQHFKEACRTIAHLTKLRTVASKLRHMEWAAEVCSQCDIKYCLFRDPGKIECGGPVHYLDASPPDVPK